MHTEAHALHHRVAALRVRRPAHHHRQLRGPRPRGASAERRQDHTRTEARGHGDVLPRDLLRRGEPQDPRSRLRPPPRLLPAQHLEHHGLLRRGDRVRVEPLFVNKVPSSTSVFPPFILGFFPNLLSALFKYFSRVFGERRLPEIINFFYGLLKIL